MHYHQLTNIPSVFGENLQPSLTKRVIPVNALHWSAIGIVWQVDRIANYQLMSNMVTGFRIVCGERANRVQDLLPLNREISDMCWNSESKRAFAVPYSTALPEKPL